MDSSQLPPPQFPSLSELESRMQVMRVSALEENQTGETFSERAEWFYQRRPLLLSLCQDLYDGYATLLDRFNNSKPIPNDNDSDTTDISSEVSFQQLRITACDSFSSQQNVDELVSKLVAANLDKDMAQHELHRKEEKFQEATKTIELLKKLVMLIDMEKEVAVQETANLGYKLASLLEENIELATEAMFTKEKAVRLARCVLKMRDEHIHKVCILENRIDELQSSRESVYEKVSSSSPSCFGIGFDNNSKSKKRKMSEATSEQGEKKKRSKWLKRLNPFTKCNVTPLPSSPL